MQWATRADKSGRETKLILVLNEHLCGQRLFRTWVDNRNQDVCFRKIHFRPCVSPDSNARENGIALTVDNDLSSPIMARGMTAAFTTTQTQRPEEKKNKKLHVSVEILERAYDVQRHTTTKAQRPEEKKNKNVQCATRADRSGRETKLR